MDVLAEGQCGRHIRPNMVVGLWVCGLPEPSHPDKYADDFKESMSLLKVTAFMLYWQPKLQCDWPSRQWYIFVFYTQSSIIVLLEVSQSEYKPRGHYQPMTAERSANTG